ncbi:MAG: hypothetical protein K0S41_820 [Anaerocolumna sp.]|jgi:methionyl-tRNA synthetase|nr:hypothetical protein [Anaerocolumna sp.]
MDTINCKICGKLFYYQTGAPICTKCTSILDEKFERVKEYLYENPGATMQQVSDVNDVSVQQIRKWVREERLEFTADSIIGVDCEICGTLIKTGRFCKNCKDNLAMKLGKAFNKPIPEEVKNELREQQSAKKFLDNRLK